MKEIHDWVNDELKPLGWWQRQRLWWDLRGYTYEEQPVTAYANLNYKLTELPRVGDACEYLLAYRGEERTIRVSGHMSYRDNAKTAHAQARLQCDMIDKELDR